MLGEQLKQFAEGEEKTIPLQKNKNDAMGETAAPSSSGAIGRIANEGHTEINVGANKTHRE